MGTTTMMICVYLYLALLVQFTLSQEPGACLSRFDYDYKVLKKLHDLEVEIEVLKQKLENRGKENVYHACLFNVFDVFANEILTWLVYR